MKQFKDSLKVVQTFHDSVLKQNRFMLI